MQWLLDGYNVLRADPESRRAETLAGRRGAGRGPLEAGRAALVRRVAEAQRRSGDSFTIVFDGVRGRDVVAPGGPIDIVFSRPPAIADDVLIHLAGRYREGGIVVTSDRTIQTAARRAGAVVVTSEQFVAALDEAGVDDADEDVDDGAAHRGSPRRVSRDERATARALTRLARFRPE
ncbi:MAG: hypothetical protein DMD81_11720 [Candidatus Rokuibacteriota bacterium]|nr:MAG: hypothetical protein DMD81_11720 [Candidatus Rokubacteria bacterium]